jgi:hypothetical protein
MGTLKILVIVEIMFFEYRYYKNLLDKRLL